MVLVTLIYSKETKQDIIKAFQGEMYLSSCLWWGLDFVNTIKSRNTV